MESITIQSETFTAPARYEEGHELTAGEAAALNQTYFENLRNNFAKSVKEAKEAGTFDLEAFQARFSDYASTYQFGIRVGGGGAVTRDPVKSEAIRIAKELIRDALKKQNKKNVEPKAITEAAHNLLSHATKGPAIMELAKDRVAATQAAAADDLADLVSDLPQKAPAKQVAAAA